MFVRTSSFYFFYFMSVGIQIIFFADILQTLGYKASQIGIIFAAPPFIKFLVPFVYRYIKVTQNQLRIYYIGLIISSFCLYFTIENFYALLVNIVFIGFFSGVLLPIVDAISIKEFKKEKYGKTRLWGSIGYILIGIVLAKIMNEYQIALHAYLFSTFLMVMSAFLIIDEGHLLQPESIDSEEIKAEPIFSQVWFWIGVSLLQISFGAMYNFFTVYEKSYGISLEVVSYLWTVGVISEILMLNFQSKILYKYSLLNVLRFCVGVTVLRWLLLFLYPDILWVTYLSQTLHAFSFALFFSGCIAYLYEVYHNKNLAQMFFQGIAFGLSGFMGSLIAGYVYGEYLFLYASIIAFIGFLAMMMQKRTI